MGTYRTTRPIIKLYPLEVSGEVKSHEDESDGDSQGTHRCKTQQNSDQVDSDTTSSSLRPRRKAYSKALQKMSEWKDTLSRAP